jgi:hypothetical protein
MNNNTIIIITRDEKNTPIKFEPITLSNFNKKLKSHKKKDLETLSLENLHLDDYNKKNYRVKTGILKWSEYVFNQTSFYAYKFFESKAEFIIENVTISKIVVNTYLNFEFTLTINYNNNIYITTTNSPSGLNFLLKGIKEINSFFNISCNHSFDISKIDYNLFFVKRNYEQWYWINKLFSCLKFEYYHTYFYHNKEAEYQYNEYLHIGGMQYLLVSIKSFFINFILETLKSIDLKAEILENEVLKIEGDTNCFFSRQSSDLKESPYLLPIGTYFRNDKFGSLRDYLIMEFTRKIEPEQIIKEIVLYQNDLFKK